jgi:hypothetical protein
MTVALFLDLFALILGLASGIAFSVGVIRIKDESLDVIAVSHYDSGAAVAKELVQQKTDFIFGSFLLFSSFLLQFTSRAIPSFGDVFLPLQRLHGVVLTLILAGILLFVCYLCWKCLGNRRMKRILELIEKEG